MSILFGSIKIFIKFFSHHVDDENVFNSYNSVNQALNQKVVGPLFVFRGDSLSKSIFGFGSGPLAR